MPFHEEEVHLVMGDAAAPELDDGPPQEDEHEVRVSGPRPHVLARRFPRCASFVSIVPTLAGYCLETQRGPLRH